MSQGLKWKAIYSDFGMGDHLLMTPIFRNFKKHYPDYKLIVAAIYSNLLRHNPYIDNLYQLGEYHDFYLKWVRPLKNPDDYINLKPYEPRVANFYNEPMSKLMCMLAKVPFDEDKLEIYLTSLEEDFAKDFVRSFRKPLILLQCESARILIKDNQKFISEKDWFKDRWDGVVSKLRDKFDFVQVGCKDEVVIDGIKVNLLGKIDVRQTAAILKYSHSFIAIDSVLQHLANAVDKKGVVLFGRSKPTVLGHESNINLIVNDSCEDIQCMRPEAGACDLMITKENTLAAWSCPHRKCMKAITVDMVCDALLSI